MERLVFPCNCKKRGAPGSSSSGVVGPKAIMRQLCPASTGQVIFCKLNLLKTESESEPELIYEWRFTANQFVLAIGPLRLITTNFSPQLNTCGHSPYVISSLTRGSVRRLQLLLFVASAVILRSESSGTHEHILLSKIRDYSNLEGQVPVYITPRTGWPSCTPRQWVLIVKN
jgi:hypothetical protein